MRQNWHRFIPRGRIKSLDFLRGLAIIMMTLPHQTVPFGLHSTAVGHQLFVIGAYYTRPLFIAVSGMALVLHEKKYRWPFRMVIHGCILFTMAWCVDVVSHGSLKIDWDIFQLIGACYAIAGLLGYIGYSGQNLIALLALLLVWHFFPNIRPDQGLFPIWPNGIYFVGGYAIAKWGLSRYNLAWLTLLLLSGSVVYLLTFYLNAERIINLSTNLVGIAASQACIFILLCSSLFFENRLRLHRFPFSIMLRFGQYPLSLYFMQQFVVVLGLRMNFRLVLTNNNVVDCFLQTSLLLLCMYAATHLFEHLKGLSIEYWLRKAENFIIRIAPQSGIFGPLPSNIKS